MHTEKWISDYALLCKSVDKSDELLIVFSAINTPEKKFTGYSIFKQYPRNILFLNCENDWYINGIKGLGKSVDETVKQIKKIIGTEFDYVSNIITFGGSMGGYGALLYGALLNANCSIGMGAETILGIYLGISRQFIYQHGKPNLKQIISDSESLFYIFYGERCFYDMLCAQSINSLDNVIIQTVRDKFHPLPAFIDSKYGLNTVINSYFSGEKFQLDKNDSGIYLKYSKLIRLCYSIRVSASKGLISQVELIEKVIEYELTFCEESIHSYAYFEVSCAYTTINCPKKALIYAQKAYGKGTKSPLVVQHFAMCLKKNKKNNYVSIFKEALQLHKPDILHDPINAYIELFELYTRYKTEDQRNLKKALELLSGYSGKNLPPKLKNIFSSFIIDNRKKLSPDFLLSLQGSNSHFFIILSELLQKINDNEGAKIARTISKRLLANSHEKN